MKTCYAYCILTFEVQDDASKEDVKQGLLEVLHENGFNNEMCDVGFEDE